MSDPLVGPTSEATRLYKMRVVLTYRGLVIFSENLTHQYTRGTPALCADVPDPREGPKYLLKKNHSKITRTLWGEMDSWTS